MAKEQVKRYKAVFERYKLYAKALQEVLEGVRKKYAPEAIVQVRPKAIISFAEKIQRKKAEFNDPVNQFTDLCGGRIITTTPYEVDAVSQFIKSNFDIDWDNSIDTSQRHRPAEFGYRSVHYIISFKRGVFPSEDINVSIPEEVFPDRECPMKAEIQVRTLLEHAWAVFTHDRTYKSSFRIPDKWQRELAALAALLEDSDKSFGRIQTGLQAYATNYGSYMTNEQIQEEIDKLQFVLELNPDNAELASRIGNLLITIGEWQKAIEVLFRYVDSGYPPVLRCIGFAMCKHHCNNPDSTDYRQGQKYLENAVAANNQDSDAIALLADTWKGVNEEKAHKLYRQAYEIDPYNPEPLRNYLKYEIAYQRNISSAALMAPVINASIKRCRDQIEVGVNIPWAFYSMGTFFLLLKEPYESLNAYAKAVQLSTAAYMIDDSLESLNKLSAVKNDLPGYEWVRRLLLIGRAARFSTDNAINKVKELASGNFDKNQPVVIVVGGGDVGMEEKMQEYQGLLEEAFKDFKGAVISGGTTQGISGLVGSIGQKYPETLYTIGYVSKMIPADAAVDKDKQRYRKIRYSEGNDFSPIEPLQYWLDMIACGIKPDDVKILGINGGRIAASEYRIALALGAKVGIIRESGREAAKLLADGDWNDSKTLIQLPPDGMTVRAFIGTGSSKLPSGMRENIAIAFHEHYRHIQSDKVKNHDPSMAEWGSLIEHLRESNRKEADHIFEKLCQIGCRVDEVKDREISAIKFSDNEIEIMAEMEHGRWNAERLMDGWRWGVKKDVVRKISPYLVSWQDLPENIREWDREMVRKIPEILARIGLEIRRDK